MSARLLQQAAFRYHGQLVPASAVDPERSSVTCDEHQVMQPHLTSSVTFAVAANWLYWSSSRYAAKPLCISQTTASSSLTLDAIVCALPTPTLSLFRKRTLGSQTGVFRWQDGKYGTVFPPHCENLTLNMPFKRLLKAFLFGETAAH